MPDRGQDAMGWATPRGRLAWAAALGIAAVYVGGLGSLGYGHAFGERDSYRVMVGLSDVLLHGRAMTGPLLYGQGASPAYYLLMRVLSWTLAPTAAGLARLAGALNGLTTLCMALIFVPVHRVACAVGGAGLGLAAVAVLGAVPVWQAVAEYAHPMWPASLAVLVAVALAARWGGPAPGRVSSATGPVVAALAVGMSMRLDIVLMTPMLLGCCVVGDRFSAALGRRALFSVAAALAIVLVLRRLGPPVAAPEGGVFDLLVHWHNPDRFVLEFGPAQLGFLKALNPLLVATFLAGVVHAVRQRRWRLLLLTVPAVVLNYLFWIPNFYPERHFLYCVPGIAIAAGCVAADVLAGRIRTRLLRPPVAAGCLLAIPALCCVAWMTGSVVPTYLSTMPLMVLNVLGVGTAGGDPRRERRAVAAAAMLCVLLAGPVLAGGRLRYSNPYDRGMADRVGCFADALASLPRLGRVVTVVGDAYPLVARMQSRRGAPLEVALHIPWLEVSTPENRYEFFIQGWVGPDAARAVAMLAATMPTALAEQPRVAADVPVPPGVDVALLRFRPERCALVPG